ncbi:hypothetical protein ENBRE01_0929 [Enteropsectra breve]|nr:hypothetical protein ENBRE01_0929 [Enteropsectra breve]
MDPIDTIECADSAEFENILRERATDAISKLNLPPFNSTGFELARTEQEIEKCKELNERAAMKMESRKRDREGKVQNTKELTAAERRKKNKKVRPNTNPKHQSKAIRNNKKQKRN